MENIAGVTLPIDSVEEFSLQTQSSPETGRNPGGTVNLVTKSGTNSIHGSAYYFKRNEALAMSRPSRPAIRRCERAVGRQRGGPFWKDHTFWFANFEKQKFNIATGTRAPSLGRLPGAGLQLLEQYGVASIRYQRLLSTLWPADALTGPARASTTAARSGIRLQL